MVGPVPVAPAGPSSFEVGTARYISGEFKGKCTNNMYLVPGTKNILRYMKCIRAPQPPFFFICLQNKTQRYTIRLCTK